MERKIDFYKHLLEDYNTSSSEFNYFPNKSLNSHSDQGVISYDYFVEKDNRRNENSIHLFFNKGASSIATANYLNIQHRKIFKTNVFVYLSRNKSNSPNLIDRIKKIITPTHIDFVEDILKEISEKKTGINFSKVEYDTPKVFINTTIYEKDLKTDEKVYRIADKEFINSWYKKENSPVLVLIGKAGIGKTTIAQYFSNTITNENENTKNILINSVEVKRRLIDDYKDNSKINLYDIYQSSIDKQSFLDEKYFRYNLDTGNIFLIIDGIDELISKVNNFDISDFLDSVNEYNQQIKNSKIIITCRNEFWDATDHNVQTLNLLSFDIEQTKEFFHNTFNKEKNKRKYDKAISLAVDFHKNNDEKTKNIYHPYALDLITKITRDDVLLKEELNTRILNPKKNTTDYIIAKMCFRENYLLGKSRITNLSIDEQVKVFQYISIVKNGVTNLEELEESVFFGINKNISISQDFETNKLTKSFSSHPLLTEFNGTIKFTYDFLVDFFKATYLAFYLELELDKLIEIEDDFLKILEDCSFGSQLVLDIAERVKSWGDKEVTYIQFLIEKISDSSFSMKKKVKLYSGVFNIVYEINKKFLKDEGLTPNKIENTKLLKKVYGEDKVRHLCMFNISEKIEFNFTGITLFENCHFYKYVSFWGNTDHKSNKFLNCSFRELGIKKTSNKPLEWIIDLNYTNFGFNSQSIFNLSSYVGMDSEFLEQFNKSKGKDISIQEQVAILTSRFIDFFWRRNYLQSQNYTVSDTSCKVPFVQKFRIFSDLPVTLDKFMELVKELELIEFSDYQGIKKINISKRYRPEITEYLVQGSFSNIIFLLKKRLYEMVR
ncbi:NACHT domain-containing protein [Kordia sp.]|uniref:NACHT domain-containing protein n=1 Tax=Kordia sp. TaxID=1965332 RepID=UPI003D2D2657